MTAYRLFLFDLDGTLFRGTTAFPSAVETVQALIADGAQVRYVTNNSGATRDELAAKLKMMGFPADPACVVNSGWLAARRARQEGWTTAWLVGEPGLVKTFRSEGLTVVNASPSGLVGPLSNTADGLVVGICRRFNYELLDGALQIALTGVPFWATNEDATYPLEEDRVQPGAGSLVAAVRGASGRMPVVLGKPQPDLYLAAMADVGCTPKETLAVGDRFDTDILAARAAGCDSRLVLTGVTSKPPPDVEAIPDLRALLAG